jgi:hypothetical protein
MQKLEQFNDIIIIILFLSDFFPLNFQAFVKWTTAPSLSVPTLRALKGVWR